MTRENTIRKKKETSRREHIVKIFVIVVVQDRNRENKGRTRQFFFLVHIWARLTSICLNEAMGATKQKLKHNVC